MLGQARRGVDQLAILALAAFWGLNWPAVRTALHDLPPWTLRFIGMGSGALFLFAISLFAGKKLLLNKGDWWRAAVIGFFVITLFNLLLAFAQLAAPTSRAVIVTFTLPIWTVLFSKLFLGEQLDGRRRLGLVIGCAGLICLGWPLIAAGTFNYGLVLALLAGIGWALGTVVAKKYPVSSPAMVVTAWQLALGAAVSFIGLAVFEPYVLHGAVSPASFHRATWIALFHHIIFSQALAFLIWYWLLTRLPASTVSLATLLVPAIGVSSSMLFLSERPTLADFTGLALMTVAAGIVMLPAGRGKVAG